MIRLCLLLFLHVSILFASQNSDILKRADTLTKSPSKTEVFRAYNDYKNVYLRSMMHANLDERRHALEGIIISGKKLHIDITQYQRELDTLKKSAKKSTVSLEKKSVNVVQNTNKITVTEQNILKDSQWNNGSLELEFDKKLRDSDVNYFKILDKQKSSFRYIFDVHAIKNSTIRLSHKALKRIRVAQYKAGTIRVVIESESKLQLAFKLENNKLIINPNLPTEMQAQIEENKPKKKKPENSSRIPKGKVVVIDPGHGGKDTGAIGYKKYREKIVVMQIANAVARRLRADGIKVYLTRSNDKFIKLRNRTNYANKKKADIFISIHANSVPRVNASKAKGIETYFLSRARTDRATRIAAVENSKEIEDMNFFGKNNLLSFMNREKIVASNKLAIDVQQGILSHLRKHYKDVKDNGVREGPFWVLVGAQMPAVLLEVGFISHPVEARRMVDKTYQKNLANGISEGIERYFINNP